MNPTCAWCGEPGNDEQGPLLLDCSHRNGAIDMDSGAWHCDACGEYVFDDELTTIGSYYHSSCRTSSGNGALATQLRS